MKLFKYKIYLIGGIGSQILHLLIGIEKALKKNISPKDIEIIVCKYSAENEERLFQNVEDIKNYLSFDKQIKISSTFKKPPKKNKLDNENADKIIYSLSNNFKKYFKLQKYKFPFNPKNKKIFWIRGLDRKFDIRVFENVAKQLFNKKDFAVITNDENNLKKSRVLLEKKIGGTSILNFECLIQSNYIITQFSAFSLVPFLLSEKKQKFLLLNKKTHPKKEFPFIDKDWEFIIRILENFTKKNYYKTYEIVDNIF